MLFYRKFAVKKRLNSTNHSLVNRHGVLDIINFGFANPYIHRIISCTLVACGLGMLHFSSTYKEEYNRISHGIISAINPIINTTYKPINGIKSSILLLNDIIDLYHQNRQLIEENVNLRNIIVRQKIILDALKSISDMEGINSFISHKSIEVPITYISHGISNFAVLNTANLEVPEYSAVLCNGGLAGRSIKNGSNAHFTNVMLIDNEYSHIPIFIASSGTRGILSGSGNGVEISVTHGTPIPNIGDIVVTAGKEDSFPANIPVGMVNKIQHGVIYVEKFCTLDKLSIATLVLAGNN